MSAESISSLELEILQTINYKIHAPTSLDFLKVFLADILGIEIQNKEETAKKEDFCNRVNSLI